MYSPQQNNFVNNNNGTVESGEMHYQQHPPGSAGVKNGRTMVMPQSVKNIHLNPQYQKGMKVMDKNSRLYSAETAHRYNSNTRRPFQTTMASF